MTKPFKELRDKLSPKAKKKSARKTKDMLTEISKQRDIGQEIIDGIQDVIAWMKGQKKLKVTKRTYRKK